MGFVRWNFPACDRCISTQQFPAQHKTSKTVEETFLRTMRQELIWNATGRKELMKIVSVHCSLLWVLSMEVDDTDAKGAFEKTIIFDFQCSMFDF